MEQSKKKRVRALLPLFALPFAALLFYVLGGGRKATPQNESPSAFNTSIPSPAEQEGTLDKLGLYQKVENDSSRRTADRDIIDFFSTKDSPQPDSGLAPGAVAEPFSTATSYSSASGKAPDQQIAHIDRRLSELQRIIDEPTNTNVNVQPVVKDKPDTDAQFRELESMMLSLRDQPNQEQDPELKTMSGMLDKILDIQHPQRVKDRAQQLSSTDVQKAYPVQEVNPALTPDYFGQGQANARVSDVFFDNAAVDSSAITENAAIPAVVHDRQTLVSGSFVKIRTQQPFYLAGKLMPSGTFLFGTCSLSGERLMIQISSIRNANSLYPVQLSVFDLDGNEGVRIPGSISRDASKQSTDQAIQSVALASLDPSIATQAASAGIEATKSLLSRKVRLIKVTVKSEYPVLLKSAKN